MLKALQGEEERQWKQLAEYLAFSELIPAADKRHAKSGAARVLILNATDSGWSTIVLHDSLPGTACGIFYGSAPPPIDPSAKEGMVTCTPPLEIDQSMAPARVSKRIYLERELAPASRPTASRCSVTSTAAGAVHLRFIVDASGHPQLSPLRIVDAADFYQVGQALEVVESCRWTPGRVNDIAVPTVTDAYVH